jgi:hypothetical protein
VSRRSNLLTPYDPKKHDGPWWHQSDSGKHYFNNKYTLELMLELDVDISLARKINFVNHHEEYCSVHRLNPKACRELGFGFWRLPHGAGFGARGVLAGPGCAVIASGLHSN